MLFEDLLTNWLALIGGISGLIMLGYMIGMLYLSKKKDKDIQDVKVQLAEVKGILLGSRVRK